jgi:hypothetical protein
MFMTFRGTIKKGVVVFAKAPRLKEGTAVRVEPIKPSKRARAGAADSSAKKSFLRPVGAWQGEAGELDRLLQEVQRLRDADLDLERDAWR